MADLLVAQNHNNTGGLAALSPQPKYILGQFTKVTPALSGAVSLQGRYLTLDYGSNIIDQPDWFSVLSQLGLSIKNAVYYADITIQVPNEADASVTNYNATARYFADATRKWLMWSAKIQIVNMVAI